MSERYILTGAPGAGKTVLIRQLELQGFGVVEEGATDIIALDQANGNLTPWEEPTFIERITCLQTLRADVLRAPARPQFHDRSIFCTHALAKFLGHPVPQVLNRAIDHAVTDGLFRRSVFFIRLLGFVTPTKARLIGLEEAKRFERIHEETYKDFGFELIDVAPAAITDRCAAIMAAIGRL